MNLESIKTYEAFVCDSSKHCKEIMKGNWDPYAIFMTIRCFNKWYKGKTYSSDKNKDEIYIDYEENGISKRYLVHRIKKKKEMDEHAPTVRRN